jgi:tRNA G26 N,N-dimethylase Trm1
VTAQSPEYAAARASVGDFKSERDSSSGLNGTTQYVNGKHMDRADNVTLGFTDCGHDAYRPGMVLDPFGGSGTTAVAAALEGRDATLIDLDRRNVDLVRRRLAENVRIISEHHDGDTVTWTVEQVTRSELVADAGGQMDLFAS